MDVKRFQYKYWTGKHWSTNGAPGNDENDPVTLGKGLWNCRVIKKRAKKGNTWVQEDYHVGPIRTSKKTRVRLDSSWKKIELI
jgi:hypothetical protein